MPATNIAEHASEVNAVSTSGANARVQGGESDLPQIPLKGGDATDKPMISLGGSKKRRSKKARKSRRKSQSKKRKTRSHRK
jgi:hypothetical protein